MTCSLPFLIWFHHRSGSTHLASLLDSHPDLACWKELFYRGEGTATEDSFTLSRAASVDSFLACVYSYRWGPAGANLCPNDPATPLPRGVGFKLKYQQATVYPRVLEYLRSQAPVKAIHLVRTNLLAALVSAALIPRLLEQFRRPNLLVGETLPRTEGSVWLEPRTIRQDLEALAARIEWGRRRLSGFQTLEIEYEALLNSPRAACASVLGFLGVDSSVELRSRYVKVLPRSVQDALANVDEIAVALRGSRFAAMLDRL